MEYQFDLGIKANIIGLNIDDEDNLEAALKEAKYQIKRELENEFEIGNIEFEVISHKVIGQTVTAKVTNIKIFEEDLQDQIPAELIVKFYFNSTDKGFVDFTGRKWDGLTLCVEDAVEDRLNEMPGFDRVSVTSVDYEIIETESGEPL